ncbi:hypothetical protein [Endozoicomonas sp. SCSIO W0465]|uniref:hypothetical protein n=1 Tax=Endozoicomonas sp. SCSIO W0465 TaxID=2918516 RepID=UPI0020756CB3|nr:hypothetical protein [Endozoicomonas sp. SCSIO W0465]USE33872.1 hypothetical protein MJO57_17010 [Endozoicomonas sp. SCSIO W0465]
MNNNIKPVWLFVGGFLVTLLWVLEFDNRPRTRLATPYFSHHLSSSTIEVTGSQKDQGRELLTGASLPENRTQPHRDRWLIDTSQSLSVDLASWQLPEQERVVQSTAKVVEPVTPFRDNNPLHAADRLYSCFDNSCLNIITDHKVYNAR